LTASRQRLRPRRTERIPAVFWGAIRRTEDAGELVAALALWGIVALVFFQVLVRYVLLTGLSWPDELARYFHIAVVFLALGAVTRRQQHIRIEYFRRRLRSPALDRLSLLIEVGAAVVLAGGAMEIIRRLGGFRTPAMEMPLALFFFPTAFGFTLMAIESGRTWFAPRRVAAAGEPGVNEVFDRDTR